MLGISDYGAFCAAIVLFLALPGPGTFALLTSTGKGGFRAGAAATFGVIAGDQVLLWLAVGGVAALLAAHPLAFRLVQYGGAAYLAWMGFRLLIAKTGAVASPVRIEPRHICETGFPDHLAQSEGDHLLHGFFPSVHRPGSAPRRRDLRRDVRNHCADHRGLLPEPVRFCRGRGGESESSPSLGSLVGAACRPVPGRIWGATDARLSLNPIALTLRQAQD